MTLGKVFGIEVRIHSTFLLMVGVVVGLSIKNGWKAAIFGAASFLTLFVFVLLHEFGHAFVARRFGIPTPYVVLTPFGGLLALAEQPRTPLQEFLVAIAGPATNLVLWILCVGAFYCIYGVCPSLTSTEASIRGLVQFTVVANASMAVFNMIPAFPMDGGRVYRALLWRLAGFYKGTLIAVRTAQVIAVLGGLFAIWNGALTAAIIAAFVFIASQAELRILRESYR